MNSDSNKIIQSLWVGRPLGTLERLTIKSFLANGHEFHLYVFDEVENIPEGTTIRDAGEIVSREELFVTPTIVEGGQKNWGAGRYSPFSDRFRCELLLKKGGWWVDMDVACLRPFDHEQEVVIATTKEWEWGIKACPNVLKAPPDCEAIRLCRDEILRRFEEEGINQAVGPWSYQKVLAEHGWEDKLQADYRDFNAVNWRYARYLLRPQEPIWHPRRIKRMLGMTLGLDYPTKASHAVHFWSEVWHQEGFDREATYHPSSMYERMKRKYL